MSRSNRDETGPEKRSYYKEPGQRYGRPRTKISAVPPLGLSAEDELAQQLDARGFLNELIRLDTWQQFKQENPDYEKQKIGPWPETADEFHRFLGTPPSFTVIEDEKTAKNALELGLILIVVDPNVADLDARLRKIGREIREKYPLPRNRPRGRPPKSGDIPGVSEADVHAWRDHRVLALRKLEHMSYSSHKDRKQLARWLFPEIKDQTKRGHKFDKAVELLEQLCASILVIDADTRV
jgi:hypothetical protein